jgi:hypothetical protein
LLAGFSRAIISIRKKEGPGANRARSFKLTKRDQNTKKRLSTATPKNEESARVPFQYEEGSSPYFIDGPASTGEFLDEGKAVAFLRALVKKGGKGRPTELKTFLLIEALRTRKADKKTVRQIAIEIYPRLTISKAYGKVRDYLSKHRSEIDG